MKRSLKVLLSILFVVFVASLIFGVLNGYFNGKAKAAKAAYASEVSRIKSEENKLLSLAEEVNELNECGIEPYDSEKGLICNSRKVAVLRTIVDIPKCPIFTKNAISLVDDKLKSISYLDQISSLEGTIKDFEYSINQTKQITNPSEELVIELTKDIEGIMDYAAVTEDNDPNGQLNKPRGYTAAIFYRYDKVPEDVIFGDDPIEIGTAGGMCIEVYQSIDDANKRNDYLAQFDGGVLASGHFVLGTMVVRTSNELTASEQSQLSYLATCALTNVKT